MTLIHLHTMEQSHSGGKCPIWVETSGEIELSRMRNEMKVWGKSGGDGVSLGVCVSGCRRRFIWGLFSCSHAESVPSILDSELQVASSQDREPLRPDFLYRLDTHTHTDSDTPNFHYVIDIHTHTYSSD